MRTQVKENLIKVRNKAICAGMTGLAMVGMLPTYAESEGNVTVNAANVNVEASPDQIISNVIGIILLVARYIGMAMLVWGLVMFALAVKNDEPESKQKALMTTFAGVILIALRSILSGAGIIK